MKLWHNVALHIVMIIILIWTYTYIDKNNYFDKIYATIKSSDCKGYIINNHITQYTCFLRIEYMYKGVLRETSVVYVGDNVYNSGEKIVLHINKKDPLDVYLVHININDFVSVISGTLMLFLIIDILFMFF